MKSEPMSAGTPRAGAIPFDTTPDAYQAQADVYRRLGGRGRLDIMFRLTESVRRIAMAGIRARHPDYTDVQVRQAYTRLQLGDALVREVWPDRPLIDP
jgi:hypothetical protein